MNAKVKIIAAVTVLALGYGLEKTVMQRLQQQRTIEKTATTHCIYRSEGDYDYNYYEDLKAQGYENPKLLEMSVEVYKLIEGGYCDQIDSSEG